MNAAKIGAQVLYIFGGGVFTLVVGLPLQIYIVRSLGAQEFGAYSLVEGVIGTSASLLAFGIAPTAVRFIPDYLSRGEGGQIKRLVTVSTLALLLIGAAGGFIIAVASRGVMAWWGANSDVNSLIRVMACTIPIGLLTFLYQQILRAFQRIFIMIVITSVVNLTGKAVLSVLFIQSGWGLIGYAWAVVLSGGFGLILMVAAVVRLVRRLETPSKEAERPLRQWIRYASVLYANGLIGVAFQSVDRFIVGALIGTEAVATLVVARQLAQIPGTLTNMFVTVTGPMFAARRGSQLRAVFEVATDWCMRLASPLILFFMLFGGALLHWYGRNFAANGDALLVLLLSAQLIGIAFGPIGHMLWLTGCEAAALRVAAIGSGAILLLYLVLIPLLGITGIGLSTALVALLGNILSLRIARRELGHVWWAERYKAWLLPALFSLTSLVALRAALGWSESIPVIWLVVALALSYGGALAGNFLQGFHVEDWEVYLAVKSKLRVALGLRG